MKWIDYTVHRLLIKYIYEICIGERINAYLGMISDTVLMEEVKEVIYNWWWIMLYAVIAPDM